MIVAQRLLRREHLAATPGRGCTTGELAPVPHEVRLVGVPGGGRYKGPGVPIWMPGGNPLISKPTYEVTKGRRAGLGRPSTWTAVRTTTPSLYGGSRRSRPLVPRGDRGAMLRSVPASPTKRRDP
jgi:hypothetical protein